MIQHYLKDEQKHSGIIRLERKVKEKSNKKIDKKNNEVSFNYTQHQNHYLLN